MARVRLSGISDWRSNTWMVCGRPSSVILKSSLVRPPTMAPVLSVTLTNRLTSLTSRRRGLSSCAARRRARPRVRAMTRRLGTAHLRSGRRAIGALHGVSRRKGLAIGPDCAVGEGFLFPDGHGFLERVDEPSAGFEGLAAMGRSDDDEHAGFPDLQAAEAVDDGNIAHFEASNRFARQLVHLLHGHLCVGLVVEVEGFAAAGVVADDAVED